MSEGIVEESTLSKRKEETTDRLCARGVGPPTTVKVLSPQTRRRNGDTPTCLQVTRDENSIKEGVM
jgi:hypothetical protein